jgi:chemotaxis protein methyltransferase CheR
MLNDEERQFEQLREYLHQIGGLDCRCYKINYLKRRLAVRMRATGLATYREYHELLGRDPTEYDKLLDRLTINVSQFFRDPEAFRALARQVLPILEKKGHANIWSAGCANGEEPYSLAMLFHERMPLGRQSRVLATDIDTVCLARAQTGRYKDASLADVPFLIRQKYLEHQGDLWTVHPEIKAGVAFERHDLTGDMPPGPFDLIVCRNVMIYFNRQLQERLLRAFHRLLLPEGFLVLGKTEVLLPECRTLYRSVDVSERIYQVREPEPAPAPPGDGAPGGQG